jgi:hypothetical protein
MKGTLSIILFYIGISLMILAPITSVGYTLYLWSHEVILSLALWTAFIMYIKIVFSGLISFGLGYSTMR